MSADGMPFKKRSNPLGGASILGSINSIREEVEAEEEKKPVKTSKPEVETKPLPKQNVINQPVRNTVLAKQTDNDREKYTATMEKQLRIQVKIASAKKGLQFSQYIEEAVKEKLEREGL